MAFINFQPKDYFNTVLWSGNSTGDNANQNITGVGFQPDFFWNKSRNQAENNIITDVLRGTNKFLRANDTTAEYTPTCNQTPISDGFTATGDEGGEFNNNGFTYATCNIKANGAGSSNTDGSITSTVSANTTSGFSIVTWTGNSGSIGHGLGKKPAMLITKSLGASGGWYTTHKSLGAEMQDNYIFLNTSDANSTNNDIWGGEPTTSTFSVGSGLIGNTTHVAYCFSPIKGFSAMGSYSGNGNADGAFIYTGFKPAWFLVKKSSASGEDWAIYDNKRNTFNEVDEALFPSATTAETNVGDGLDFCSNGIKIRDSGGELNTSGATYIYMAFAESPIVSSNGVPATAK